MSCCLLERILARKLMKMTNISLVRKCFHQLPLNFQQSFTSAMQMGNYKSFYSPKLLGEACSIEPLCKFERRSRGVSHRPCFRRSFNLALQKLASSMCQCVPVEAAFVLLYTQSNLAFFCQTRTTGLNTPKLISNCRTITTSAFITPCNDGSIFQ